MNVVLTQTKAAIALDIDNHGDPTQLLFEPRLPLGARLVSSTYQGRRIASHIVSLAEEERTSLMLPIPAGKSHCDLQFEGGIAMVSSADQSSRLQAGDPSTHLKITAFSLSNRTLSIEADVHAPGSSTLVLRTPWKLITSKGATNDTLPNGDYQINIPPPIGSAPGSYSHTRATLTFADR